MSADTTVLDGVGLTDPTLAYGLTGVSDFSSEMPFLNLVKEMRPWTADGSDGGMKYTDLVAGDYLDANGYVTHMPDGMSSVRGIWAWGNSKNDASLADYRSGTYVLNYDGEGTIKLGGNVKVLSSEPGHIVFQNTNGGTMWFDITSTDPNNTGDYIHNISVVDEKYQGLYQTGEIFNPDWLSVINDARELRFMDWMGANGTNSGDWADRGHVGDATYMTGVPVEVMVQLANQTGADPWFTIPKEASADYITEFATYVRDHLNPGLVAHVEYANEAWNGVLNTYHWLEDQSLADWGTSAPFDYYAMKATQTALIWDQVFGSEASTRVDNVLASHTGLEWLTEHNLNAPVWLANDPSGYVAPYTVFDSVAITTYFGNQTLSQAGLRAELLTMLKDPAVDAAQWLAQKLMDPNYAGSIPRIEAQWDEQKAMADKYGMKLIAYEGGQHVFQSFSTKGMTADDVALMTNFLTDFVRSPEMGQLYNQLWTAWEKVSDGPFMQYGDVSAAGKYGSWGLLSSLADTNPRAEALIDHNATSSSWFGDGGGSQYQQGVILIADDTGQVLLGTQKDDYLVGGAGNDVLISGTGHDGINGGDGTDTLVLAGLASDYTLVHEGAGYRLTGPNNTSDYILNIEDFRFDGNVTKTLAELLAQPPHDAGSGSVGSSSTDGSSSDGQVLTGVTDTGAGPKPVVLSLATPGVLLDASQASQVAVEDGAGKGVRIDAINAYSALGKELGINPHGDVASYTVVEKGASVDFNGTQVSANYWSLQNNTAGKSGAALSDSAVDTALHFGSVATEAHAITGTSGNDTFLGAGGVAEVFYGGAGNDYIDGRGGGDSLYGGDGNDVLVGRGGNDVLTGGAGSDRFYISPGDGHDIITDFSQNDKLDLRGLHLSGADLNIAAHASTDAEGNLQLQYDHNTITLVGLHESDLSWMSLMV